MHKNTRIGTDHGAQTENNLRVYNAIDLKS